MRRLWLLLAGLLLTTVLAAPAHTRTTPRDEVRVLVDVSGSMKHNDPRSLRAPALRLLVNLLPPDSRAGVWTFGEGTTALVPPAEVTDGWRRQALAASAKIHSRDQRTDIGAGLKAASRDWHGPDPGSRRNLIILSDGMVDVSKVAAANTRAREEILQQLLPALRRARVRVHAIALSSSADRALLQALATGTDGGYAEAESADQLQRLFLRMFERSVQRDALPLQDNRFKVDPSVRELTLLAFRKPEAAPTRLRPPRGQAFAADRVPAGVRWHREAGYDLVTINNPEPGEWTLQADIDPDNRVLIVTDLALAVSPIPNNVFTGETLPLRIALSERGNAITRQDFLSLLSVQVEQRPAGAAPRRWLLADNGMGDDGLGGDGVFSLALSRVLVPGQHELLVDVDGKTFRRQQRHTVTVFTSPLDVEVVDQPGTGRSLLLRQSVDWVDPASLKVGARLMRLGQGGDQLTLPRLPSGEWRLDLPDSDDSHLRVELEATGRTASGRPFTVRLAPVEFAPPPVQPVPEAPEPAVSANWPLVGAVLFTGNVAVFAALALAVYLLRRRRRRSPSFGDLRLPAPPSESESK